MSEHEAELRDWFAGMALQGWLAGRDPEEIIDVDHSFRNTAKGAYLFADAMLAARTTPLSGES